MVENVCSLHGTLKSVVSQEWFTRLICFFACWYNFMKIKNNFNNFWMVVVKNGCGLLGHGVLKSALSQEWIDE